ncbi:MULTISPECIES: hypothetical protein [unclassified Streptomyces]|uniref:hypothetical protein n=1 Tax=unclassified Streptomyces TaxID=2593676 RepID=UPI00342BDE5B
MHVRKMAAQMVAAATVLAGAVIGTAVPAHAAGGCWNGGFNVNSGGDYTYRAYMCHNRSGAPVWGATRDMDYPNTVVGYMYSNPSWFACRIDNGQYNGNDIHPYRWLLTQADNGAWGWMKDTDISSETNPVPSCEDYWSGRL